VIFAAIVSCFYLIATTLPLVAFGWFLASLISAVRNPLPVEQEIELPAMSEKWLAARMDCDCPLCECAREDFFS
jgi:hypothetical protein